MKKISKKEILEMTTKLGRQIHEDWRLLRKRTDGTFESRFKKTIDKNWSKKHGTDRFDISNTNFVDLPEDWKNENYSSAKVAINEILNSIKYLSDFDSKFIEKAADLIHEKRLGRLGDSSPINQKKPYVELSEAEKEKDRVIIKKAIEIYNFLE